MALRTKGEIKQVAKDLVVLNDLGLHARPAAQFVRLVQSFRSEMWITIGESRYHAGRLMDVLLANLDKGAKFTLEANGPDADSAIARIERLMAELRDAEEKGDL